MVEQSSEDAEGKSGKIRQSYLVHGQGGGDSGGSGGLQTTGSSVI